MLPKSVFALLLALAPASAFAQAAPAQPEDGEPGIAQSAPPRPPAIPGVDRDAWLLSFPQGPADTYTRQGVRTGSRVERADCDTTGASELGRFVFVEAMGRGACIRYHLSSDAFPEKVAAVFLPGDKGRFRIIWRDGRYEMIPEELLRRPGGPAPVSAPDLSVKLGDPARNQNFAHVIAARVRAPAILLARQGIDGSSGWVALRRTRWEVAITSAALDAIKARHGIERLHLVGQSGGGHLVGALAALRSDIVCAVAGSAPLAYDRRSFYLSSKLPAPQRFFNPVDFAAAVAKKPGLRLMLVTDGSDSRVFVERQALFARALARYGAKPPQFFVSASDPMRHGVTVYSVAALRGCIAGQSDDEIAVQLARMNATALERRLKQTRRPAGAPQTAVPGPQRPSGSPAPAAPRPEAGESLEPLGERI